MVKKKLYGNYLTISVKKILERMYRKEIDPDNIGYELTVDNNKKKLIVHFSCKK